MVSSCKDNKKLFQMSYNHIQLQIGWLDNTKKIINVVCCCIKWTQT
jgi:hypothetical protein